MTEGVRVPPKVLQCNTTGEREQSENERSRKVLTVAESSTRADASE